MLTLGRFRERPPRPGGPAEENIPARSGWGPPILRRRAGTPK